MEERSGKTHKLCLINRSIGEITGVQKVKSFNQEEILLETDMGKLSIKGKGLHVTRLTLEQGQVEVEGTVDTLIYTGGTGEAPSGVFKRLFQ